MFSCLFFFAKAQDTSLTKESQVSQWIQGKTYTFVAQSVMPVSGPVRQLTSEYTLTIAGDTTDSYLPYFGRSYSPPISNEGGIKFTSTSSTYEISPRKKDGWNISIKPTDVRDIQRLQLTVFENGTASLQVTSANRQAISFNGYIRKNEMKKGRK